MGEVFHEVSRSSLPTVSKDEMVKIDEIMEKEYKISIYQMMENAGYLLARLTTALYGDADHVFVLVGKGNNGGGGLVAARRLALWGYKVSILSPLDLKELTEVPSQQIIPLQKLNIEMITSVQEQQATLASSSGQLVVLDALLGYRVESAPRSNYASLISLVNSLNLPIISLDTPTGMNVTTGEIYEPTIKATKTLTLGALKHGFFTETALLYHGEVFLGDISIPPQIFHELGIKFPETLFQKASLIKIINE